MMKLILYTHVDINHAYRYARQIHICTLGLGREESSDNEYAEYARSSDSQSLLESKRRKQKGKAIVQDKRLLLNS